MKLFSWFMRLFYNCFCILIEWMSFCGLVSWFIAYAQHSSLLDPSIHPAAGFRLSRGGWCRAQLKTNFDPDQRNTTATTAAATRGAWRPSRGWQWPPTVTTCGVWPPSTVTTAWPPESLQCHRPLLVTNFSPSLQPTNPSKQLQWATWRSWTHSFHKCRRIRVLFFLKVWNAKKRIHLIYETKWRNWRRSPSRLCPQCLVPSRPPSWTGQSKRLLTSWLAWVTVDSMQRW